MFLFVVLREFRQVLKLRTFEYIQSVSTSRVGLLRQTYFKPPPGSSPRGGGGTTLLYSTPFVFPRWGKKARHYCLSVCCANPTRVGRLMTTLFRLLYVWFGGSWGISSSFEAQNIRVHSIRKHEPCRSAEADLF